MSRLTEFLRPLQFPEDWPCGSPDQTRALFNRLTHQGHDLARRCQMNELLDKQTQEAVTELGKSLENETKLAEQELGGTEERGLMIHECG